ncbi:phosphotransferase family protein [Bacillus sp. S10(2024)]|uniref:phosphotransferase family protein n=1 Tax=Bacillus sp. S10(2024) TaxID=3162886 RepID=UPI003D23A27A
MPEQLKTKIINQLRELHSDLPICNIVSLKGGYLNHVFQMNNNSDSVIVWFSEDRTSPKLSRQLLAIKMLKNYFGSLIPDVYASNQTSIGCYYMMNKLKGNNLEQSLPYLTTNEQINFFELMGNLLGNIHSIRSENQVGYLENMQNITWKDWLNSYITSLIQELLSIETKCRNQDWLMVQKSLIAHLNYIDEPINYSFLHGDYYPGNILHDNGFISGLLDFEWSLFGDPLYDFRVMEVFIFGDFPYREVFYNSYRKTRKLPNDFYKTIAFYTKVYQLELILVAYRFFEKNHYFIETMEPELINWASK